MGGGALAVRHGVTALRADACRYPWPVPPRRRLALAVILSLASCRKTTLDTRPPPKHPPLIAEGGSVFFVGNSFFGWQGRVLPQWVSALGASMPQPIPIEASGDIVFGDAPLADFLEHDATREALAAKTYDVFVLQGHELEAVDDKEGFFAAVRAFDGAVRKAGGRTALFMTWDFPWRPFIADVAAAYDEIGKELGVPVIPAGLVYEDCRRAPPEGQAPYWLTASAANPKGDLHPNEKGAAVNTYATFATLTGVDPRGVNFEAPGNTNDDALMKRLSDHAWARVRPRLTTASGK